MEAIFLFFRQLFVSFFLFNLFSSPFSFFFLQQNNNQAAGFDAHLKVLEKEIANIKAATEGATREKRDFSSFFDLFLF